MTPPGRVYESALRTPGLGRALNWLRWRPGVRRLVRRWRFHRLAPGSSWHDLDSALRSLRGQSGHRVVFGPWVGSLDLELLCWLPFVRWAAGYAELDRSQVIVVARGTSKWYAGFAGAVHDLDPSDRREIAEPTQGASRVDPAVLVPLWERYASGVDGVREVLRHSSHERLPVVAPSARAAGYLAVDLRFGKRFADTPVNRTLLERADRALASHATVDLAPIEDPIRRAELVAASAGLISTGTDGVSLGPLLGVPTVVLRGSERSAPERYLDLAQRIARELGSPLTSIDADRLSVYADALGFVPREPGWSATQPVPSGNGRERRPSGETLP